MVTADFNAKRLKLFEWANEHGLVVDPFKGMDMHIDAFDTFEHCPCDKTKTRLSCPCEESLSDINAKGRCLCGLFWTRNAVMQEITKQWNNKPHEQ